MQVQDHTRALDESEAAFGTQLRQLQTPEFTGTTDDQLPRVATARVWHDKTLLTGQRLKASQEQLWQAVERGRDLRASLHATCAALQKAEAELAQFDSRTSGDAVVERLQTQCSRDALLLVAAHFDNEAEEAQADLAVLRSAASALSQRATSRAAHTVQMQQLKSCLDIDAAEMATVSALESKLQQGAALEMSADLDARSMCLQQLVDQSREQHRRTQAQAALLDEQLSIQARLDEARAQQDGCAAAKAKALAACDTAEAAAREAEAAQAEASRLLDAARVDLGAERAKGMDETAGELDALVERFSNHADECNEAARAARDAHGTARSECIAAEGASKQVAGALAHHAELLRTLRRATSASMFAHEQARLAAEAAQAASSLHSEAVAADAKLAALHAAMRARLYINCLTITGVVSIPSCSLVKFAC